MLAWDEPLGRALRLPLRLMPRRATVPILSGPNRGFKWTVGSSIHGCWLGTYERDNAALLLSLSRPGMTAFDVGANAGYFTLLFSRATGAKGRIFAFEPDTSNLASLRRHLDVNGIGNVTIVPAAASNENGSAAFEPAASMARLTSTGGSVVETTRLDRYPSPDLVKMDIEGAEGLALLGAERILAERRTTWFIELHGEQRENCIGIFGRHGYRVRDVGAQHILAAPPSL